MKWLEIMDLPTSKNGVKRVFDEIVEHATSSNADKEPYKIGLYSYSQLNMDRSIHV